MSARQPGPGRGKSGSPFDELTGVPPGTDAPAPAPAVAGQGTPPTSRSSHWYGGDSAHRERAASIGSITTPRIPIMGILGPNAPERCRG